MLCAAKRADFLIPHKVSLMGAHSLESRMFGVNIKNAPFHSLSFKRGSKALTRLLLTRLGGLGLDPAHIVGQGYDDQGYAGNVSGKACCVKARIAAVSCSSYVHCINHALNLAIVHSTKVRDVRNCLDTVQQIVL